MDKVSELAFFGGRPLFENTLHVGRPNLGNREKFFERMDLIWNNNWLTNNGQFVREFESRIANLLNVKHCVAICNATIALEIAIRGLGMSGEVIIPSFTFIATAHSLQWQEITPIFCDIHPDTHSINPACIERLITPRTTGIIAVNLWGQPCAINELERIAEQYKLKLLFDSAHAFGASYQGQMLGGFGNAEVFSFHATKFLNSFEGGAIVTNDDNLANKTRLMNNFGFTGMDEVSYLGTNGKMSEPAAAMGLTSLESMDEFIEINKRNYRAYRENLKDTPGCRLLEFNEQEKNNFQYIVIEINEKDFGLSRDQVLRILHAENIRARRYFYPGCHNAQPYCAYFPNTGLLLPVTNSLIEKVLCLPTGRTISVAEIKQICSLIRFLFFKQKDIANRLEIKQLNS